MQIGDNMLAIYASEKALRLAERLGEARRGEPRARDLRPRVRADRRHARRRARTSSGRRVWRRESDDAVRRCSRCRRSATTSSTGKATTRAPAAATRRRSALPSGSATCRRRSSCTRRSAQLAFYRCDWDDVALAADTSAELAEREGLVGKLCLPTRCAAGYVGAKRTATPLLSCSDGHTSWPSSSDGLRWRSTRYSVSP